MAHTLNTVAFCLAVLLITSCDKKSDSTTPNSSNNTGGGNNNTSVTVTDIDGNTYATAMINGRRWMTENLRVTHYRNGDPVTHVADSAQWCALTTEAWCDHSNDPSLAATYGKLYNFWAVVDARNLAPEGWHVATAAEMNSLVAAFGGTDVAGKELKESGTAHWIDPNNGTNSSGFTARPNGLRYSTSLGFESLQRTAYLWTSDALRICCWMPSYDDKAHVSPFSASMGLGVRCVKD